MSESNPLRYKIDKVPKLSGFSVVSVAAGNYGWFLARGFVHSDQKEFYKYIGQLYGQFVGTRFLVHEVNTFLALIHQDSSADVYVNNGVPTSLLVMAKGDFQQGQLVSIKDFADITELRFDGIPIKGDDSLVFCFRQRWKFGLFFDFAPVTPNIEKREIDFDQLYKELGSYYKYLAFQEVYETIQDERSFLPLFEDGWFPFIQLLGSDYQKLSEIYQDTTNHNALLDGFLDTFDKERIDSFIQYWWRKKDFEDKREILNAGIEAYLENTQNGYISCIKILHSEIGGILQLAYFREYGKDPNFRELKAYVRDKASSQFTSTNSLGFPVLLFRYFDEVVFGNFNLRASDIGMSRHSTTHGVAPTDKYTKERALQAILTLDQLHFFMN